MDIHVIKPLEDPRWADLINQHPKASVFHTTAWLGALSRTYGYKPVAFTTSPPDGPLGNGLVACDVRSWLTGHRLVSLPFSDYCEPLFDSPDELQFVIRYLQDAVSQGKWNYVEFRPVSKVFGEVPRDDCLQPNGQYLLHRLDLQPQTEELFQNLDKDSVQRRIRRAERAGLTEECGRSEDLLRKFYTLLIITRRRHHLPPQPYAWFRNLVHSFGDALEIRTVVKDQIPVASILTLRFKDMVYYKYGCSDARYNNLGATPLLLWRAIAAAKSTKAQIFDFGRTEADNPGLISFKDKWAPRSNPLVYLRFPHRALHGEARNLRVVKQIFARMPEKLLAITGSLIYRHIG
jgi:CelD/BcsL family acetyltransferase involved in cellulose biosynthesis